MNIKDIAQMSGVSRATVSRYLNHGYVSDEKKQKIKEVIEKTGYVPSTQAQMLRTKQTRLIGVIIPKINSETVSRILKGIGQVLESRGYHMLVANTENHYEKELEYLKIFANDRVDGVILLASIRTRQHHKLLAQLPVPVVIAGQETEKYSCVFHDDRNAAKALTLRLLEKGCKNPVFLGVTDADTAAGMNRRLGFEDALKAHGLWSDHIPERACEFDSASGYNRMKELIDSGIRFDGVLCATDNIAAGALRALREAGIDVPGQIKLAGFGDTQLASLVTPPMTTVHYHYEESGKEAAEMVMEQIRSGTRCVKSVMLGYEIVPRNTL
ncbi:MAG TPA: LacI family DNA-binding transcriptional regulator [Candidatus Scybalocola faecavium]|nr:LacI family DNA-binding transcriptional regulator [Candidatus Scybalocola faecavium]